RSADLLLRGFRPLRLVLDRINLDEGAADQRRQALAERRFTRPTSSYNCDSPRHHDHFGPANIHSMATPPPIELASCHLQPIGRSPPPQIDLFRSGAPEVHRSPANSQAGTSPKLFVRIGLAPRPGGRAPTL